MIQRVTTDTITEVMAPVNYNVNNPVVKLMKVMEEASFFAEQPTCYVSDSLQFLFPFNHLELYGPSAPDQAVLNPELQDNKTDFQKQNTAGDHPFCARGTLGDTYLVRGLASVKGWTGPFLKLSYRGDPDSALSKISENRLSDFILLFIRVQGNSPADLIKVPYNEQTHRYEVEIWGYPGPDLYDQLSEKGQE